ncbi:molybdenum cofactor guanylyltransferase [Marinomonas sp. THO17]|uniref:molybdenum cofactor guanylyltransferase n=1 Tax=Marinomonas sp. THO17 TaxID=3149048 RepID=UPI00336C0A31
MDITSVTGVVLAGGKGERVSGEDKGLLSFRGKPMAQHVANTLDKVVDRVVINANRHLAEYEELGFEVCADDIQMLDIGPLAGLYTCLSDMKTSHLIISPCDTPLISVAAFEALLAAAKHSPTQIHYLHNDQGSHPLHAIMPVASSLFALDVFLSSQDGLSVLSFYEDFGCQPVCWRLDNELSNFNSWEDLKSLK